MAVAALTMILVCCNQKPAKAEVDDGFIVIGSKGGYNLYMKDAGEFYILWSIGYGTTAVSVIKKEAWTNPTKHGQK